MRGPVPERDVRDLPSGPCAVGPKVAPAPSRPSQRPERPDPVTVWRGPREQRASLLDVEPERLRPALCALGAAAIRLDHRARGPPGAGEPDDADPEGARADVPPAVD